MEEDMDYLASMERNMEIYNKRKEGATFKSIAQEFGISTERVRQICISLDKRDQSAMESDLYQLIVDENSHSYTVSLYNTLRKAGIETIDDLKSRMSEINEHPERYVYIGEKSRIYLNKKLEHTNIA